MTSIGKDTIMFIRIAFLLITISTVAKGEKLLPNQFTLENFDSQQFSIDGKDFAKKGLVMQFWAPWCHSCSTVVWDLNPILKKYKDVRFASINIGEDKEKAQNYIKKHRLYNKYKNSFYTNSSKNLLKALSVNAVPIIFVIDKNGKILHESRSHIDAQASFSIRKALDTISN